MNAQVNAMLEDIKSRMQSDGYFNFTEMALGASGMYMNMPHGSNDHAGGHVGGHMGGMHMGGMGHRDSMAGVGQAHNYSDIHDDFNRYIADVVDKVKVEFGVSQAEALACLRSGADEMTKYGMLPAVPSDEDLQGTAQWLGLAKSVGLTGWVMKSAYAKFGGTGAGASQK